MELPKNLHAGPMDVNKVRGITGGSGGCWVEGSKGEKIGTTVTALSIKKNNKA